MFENVTDVSGLFSLINAGSPSVSFHGPASPQTSHIINPPLTLQMLNARTMPLSSACPISANQSRFWYHVAVELQYPLVMADTLWPPALVTWFWMTLPSCTYNLWISVSVPFALPLSVMNCVVTVNLRFVSTFIPGP